MVAGILTHEQATGGAKGGARGGARGGAKGEAKAKAKGGDAAQASDEGSCSNCRKGPGNCSHRGATAGTLRDDGGHLRHDSNPEP